MNILIYYPSNKSSISIETVMRHFRDSGHNVFFLSHEPSGSLHSNLKSFGVKTFSHTVAKNNSIKFYLTHIFFLIKFIRRHKIQIIYSHIQQANLIASVAQFFVKAKVILCRHHSDLAIVTGNTKEQRADKILRYIGRHFIAPSLQVYKQMISEGIPRYRISLINYAYDFSLFPKPDLEQVKEIRKEYRCQLLLCIVSRYVSGKGYEKSFNIIQKLVQEENLDIKLICIGGGPLEEEFQKLIHNKNLQNHIYLLNFKNNVLDYIAASDVVLHLSISEASNSVIKEAGLLSKPVIVCEDVGDFDDYIDSGKNGIKVNKSSPENLVYKTIKTMYSDLEKYKSMGENLKNSVLHHFSYQNIVYKYDQVNQELLKK